MSVGIDLSALEGLDTAGAPAAPAAPSGEPLRVPLNLIEEDPDQPRREFDQDAMDVMVASIKLRGVKSPVSLKPHPDKAGHYILNYGARRYRASKEAGLPDIPAFVDLAHTDYDQVIENEQRENLTPMELALFIRRKLDDGDKKAAIAKNLGKRAEAITFHLALIDMPPAIEAAYGSGRLRSPQVVYALRALHEKHAEAVQGWLDASGDDDITRGAVDALTTQLKGGQRKTGKDETLLHAKDAGASSGADAGARPVPAQRKNGGEEGSTGNSPGPSSAGANTAEQGAGADPDRDLGELTSWPKGKAVSDPNLMKKPLLLVEYDGRSAALLLNRRPGTDGLVWIRYEDNGGDDQVDAGALKINRLMEE